MKRQLAQIIDKRSNGILQDIDSIIEYLQDILPHGSGIDSNWSIEYKPSTKKVYAHNSYHLMDENGYYSGWVNFTVSYRLHDKDEFETCKYCLGSGLRYMWELAKVRNETYEQTFEALKGHFTIINPHDRENAHTICNFCSGKGKIYPNSFEFGRFNFHSNGRYAEAVSYGITDYLEELLYNPETDINWHNEQKAKSGV